MKIDSPTFLTETTFVSASVQFSSGSQKFGDTLDDTHQFTGSLNITGSIVVRPGNSDLTDNGALGLWVKGLNGGIKIGRHSGNDGAYTHLYTDISTTDFLYVKNNGANNGGIATDRIGSITQNPMNNYIHFDGYNKKFYGYNQGSKIYEQHDNTGISIMLPADDTFKVSGSLIQFTPTEKVNVTGNIEASGNISGSSTSTGSFGRVSTSKLHNIGGQGADISWAGAYGAMKIEYNSSYNRNAKVHIYNRNTAGNYHGLTVHNNDPDAPAISTEGTNANISGSATSTGSFGSVHTAGNIGVGTTATRAKLHIEDGTDAGIILEDSGESSGVGNVRIRSEGGELKIESLNASFATHKTILRTISNTGLTRFVGGQDIQAQVSVGGVYGVNNSDNSAGVRLGYSSTNTTFRITDTTDGSAQFTLANATGHAAFKGNVEPMTDNTSNLGSSTKRWANIHSADLHLSNEDTEGNEVDGTTGNWTIQEGEDDLFLLNRKNGKKYRFKLEEIT